MNLNPLIALAGDDRHDPTQGCCGPRQRCRACGAHVSTYNVRSDAFTALRPEAAEWDWWVACDNADCARAYGEGLFQDPIDWVVEAETP